MSMGAQAIPPPMALPKEEIHVTGRRVVATLIDGLIGGFAYNVLVLLFGTIDHPRAWEWSGTLESVPANALFALGALAYFTFMEGYLGQTFGKMVAGITVVREGEAGPPGLRCSFIRTVLRIVDGFFGYAVAFIVVLASEKRQRCGDMAAGTLVVRK